LGREKKNLTRRRKRIKRKKKRSKIRKRIRSKIRIKSMNTNQTWLIPILNLNPAPNPLPPPIFNSNH
jgi:hypothetical protein